MPSPIDIPSNQFVTLDGIRFHYLDWAARESPCRCWRDWAAAPTCLRSLPAPSDRFRVPALTRRGHGLSDQVQGGHALGDAAEDARRLLDALGVERAHVVGHSMGGGEVSALAARHPGRVASVVYLDGAYDGPDRPYRQGSEEQASPDRFALFEDDVDFVRSYLPDGLWGPAFNATVRTFVDTHADGSVVDKLSDEAAAPFVQAVNAFRHPYSEITAPALAIYAVRGPAAGGRRDVAEQPPVTALRRRRRRRSHGDPRQPRSVLRPP